MTFYALLLKEIRLRVRRERLVWILVVYVSLLGLLEWQTFNNSSGNYNIYTLNSTGTSIYLWLTFLQFLLIVFIAPAFTASAINAEKERQTYELLLCSRLSSFSLVAGKLIAGLSSTLLLMAATIPLFSLIFFFGGVDPLQIVKDQIIFLVTAVLVATFALFCSALFPRPAASTAVTYVGILLWLISPLIIMAIVVSAANMSVQNISIPIIINQGGTIRVVQNSFPLPLIWHPATVLYNGTFLNGLGAFASYGPAVAGPLPINKSSVYVGSGRIVYPTAYIGGQNPIEVTYALWNGFSISSWWAYIILSLIAIAILFLLCLWVVKPYPIVRLRNRFRRHNKKSELPGHYSLESAGALNATSLDSVHEPVVQNDTKQHVEQAD